MRQLFKNRWVVLGSGIALLALIAWADLEADDAVPLGLLYIVPIVLLCTILNRWQVALLGVTCTVIAELGMPIPGPYDRAFLATRSIYWPIPRPDSMCLSTSPDTGRSDGMSRHSKQRWRRDVVRRSNSALFSQPPR